MARDDTERPPMKSRPEKSKSNHFESRCHPAQCFSLRVKLGASIVAFHPAFLLTNKGKGGFEPLTEAGHSVHSAHNMPSVQARQEAFHELGVTRQTPLI